MGTNAFGLGERGRQPSAPPGGRLPLSVEVDGGDREAEVVLLGEAAGIEAVPRRRRRHHRLSPLLLEEYKDEAVDADAGPGALVAHHLLPCFSNVT